MISNPPRLDSGLFRESVVVIALTMIGAVIRLWSIGHIGLIHFDEGIYALAGLWAFSPRGLLALDPNLIAYAPPGFCTLVGVSYLLFGVSDVAAVLVSIVSGTLTIPAVGWVARRTFGSGAGAAAAAFSAFSGAHVAFSRMALVDATFLLFWVLAIGQGQRFLERPNPWRAISLGFAVGIAQLFKYNGWVSGVIVALSAGLWLLLHPVDRKSRTAIATCGWGLVAAMVAAIVYWPWYQFVESHGGYAALLAHQRSYLGGFSAWAGHFSVQLDQAEALSGGPVWWGCGGFIAAVAMRLSLGDFGSWGRVLFGIPIETLILAALCLNPDCSWWLSLFWLCILMIMTRGTATRALYFLFTGWLTLSLLTPFYHPYSRLWLPVQAFGWISLGGASAVHRMSRVPKVYAKDPIDEILGGASAMHRKSRKLALRGPLWTKIFLSNRYLWPFLAFCALLILMDAQREALPLRLLEPSDSVRTACRAIQKEIPQDMKTLRVFARRPVVFYLALSGNIAILPQPDLKHLLLLGAPTSWALLDMALIRQDNISEEELNRSLVDWVVVRDLPTTLNVPTLLDIEPAAARSGTVNVLASLRLLRPKRAGEMP